MQEYRPLDGEGHGHWHHGGPHAGGCQGHQEVAVGQLERWVLAVAVQALVVEKPDGQLGELVGELRVWRVQRRMA